MQCRKKVASGRRVAGAKVLYESLLVPVHMYGSETMI